MLIDSFHRVHSYLRISLTDKCNLRCFYCMPNEDHPFVPSSHLMNADEIYSIASSFVKLGVKKIRLTGGEPLIRNDAHEIIENLTRLPAELSLTTNGTRIHKFGDLILNSGIKSINISLDTLQRERFLKITRRDSFNQVISNIEWLLSLKIQVKINVVAMKGENEDEIIDFIRYTQTKPVQVRFIEFMPFSGNNWNIQRVLTLQEILSAINAEFLVEKLEDKPNDTAKNYKVRGYQGSFAIISTLSSPFCNTCNRIRFIKCLKER
jgi:cyclic pyranopterin phosphate synthase